MPTLLADKPTVILGVLIAVVLGAAMFDSVPEYDNTAPISTRAAPPAGDNPPSLSSDPAPELDDYSESLERPLFWADRRPPPPPAALPAEDAGSLRMTKDKNVAPAGAMKLVGIAIDKSNKIAIVNAGRSKVERVHENDEVAGWTIQSIEPKAVTIERDAQSEQLELERKSSAQPQRRKVPAARAAADAEVTKLEAEIEAIEAASGLPDENDNDQKPPLPPGVPAPAPASR